ncbi:MAG: lipoyl domain-containing protein [Burkholderiales bacterium]|nr:lipoyl domain-containing protein [Burkholderiales bacterium]OJX06035.1 MAG: biotin attachment protein [Burkholderiales bacterium 70-64]
MTRQIVLDDACWKDVEEGTEALLDRWLVAEGDAVKAGATVAVVVLVKTSIEVPAPADGVLERILVPAEGTFARSVPIGTLREAG